MEKMKDYKIILIIFLISISAFSIFRYSLSLKEKYDLKNDLEKIANQVRTLESERQNLLQELEKEKQSQQQLAEENTGFKESLKTKEEEMAKFNADFIQAQANLRELSSQTEALKTENNTLKEEKGNLQAQLAQTIAEKDSLKARLSSVQELKKAIRELKKQVRRVGKEIKEKVSVNTSEATDGNRGFVIKNGKSTFPAKFKIEVIPAPATQK